MTNNQNKEGRPKDKAHGLFTRFFASPFARLPPFVCSYRHDPYDKGNNQGGQPSARVALAGKPYTERGNKTAGLCEVPSLLKFIKAFPKQKFWKSLIHLPIYFFLLQTDIAFLDRLSGKIIPNLLSRYIPSAKSLLRVFSPFAHALFAD
jgi:hypothetical protein